MISMMAATSINGVLGIKGSNQMLWKSRADLLIFQRNTRNRNIVMGNATFKTLDAPLKNRNNIVLSRTEKEGTRDGVTYFNNMTDIVKNYEDFSVIGGESIYRLFLPITDEVILSTISIEYETEPGDDYAYFPSELMEKEFFLAEESEVIRDVDLLSNLPINIIICKWKRGVTNVH